MKRRWALLLALSLTFASIPVTGAGAAEAATTADTEIVTEIAAEEIPGEGVSVEEAVVPTEEDKDETAADAGTTTGQETTETKDETVDENAAADTTATENENAAAGITDTEVAAVEEPVVITDGKDAKNDASVNSGWVEEGTNKYYYGSEGTPLTNWQKIDGSWYYFDASGVMQKDWQKINDKWYHFDENGAMQLGWQDLNNHRYYFDPSGKMVTGWQKIDGNWYFFGPGGVMQKDWQQIKGKWYHFDENGAMQLGWQNLSTWRYYFDPSGKMVTGFQMIDGKWYYFNAGGGMLTGWQKIGGIWYYLSKEDGVMATGWQKLDGYWYYFDPTSGAMATGWRQVNGNWYYLQSGGRMATGWTKVNNNWYYLRSGGSMATLWVSDGGYWYYLDPAKGGAMATTPRYCKTAGNTANDYYFFYTNGRMGTGKGWKKNGAFWYYTHEDGTLYRDTTIKDNGKSYYLDEYGRWGDAMDNKAQGYSSATNYLILVDKSTFKVRVYKGSKGSWTRIKNWDCTHGGSDTPNGVFTIDDHVTKRDATWGWADFDFSSAAFACHISAGNYFHSILFNKGTRGNPYEQRWKILDDELRTTYSHGCIRLELENAEWVWDNIPFGTKVVVYNS